MGRKSNHEGKIRKTLKFSFWDGFFASCMSGMVADYITPYALALKATSGLIGILNAAPNFVSSLIQLKSADFAEAFKSRKKIIVLFVLFHALMGIPIILTPYLFKGHAVLFLIIFVTLFNSLNAFAGPAWASLMSEYIPIRKRGKYFGWRNRILGIVTIVCAFIAGFILHYYKNNIFRGFLIIFSAAFCCRIVSWYFLTRMYEPPFKTAKESYFSFLDFIKRAKASNFAKFVIFTACLNFCVNLASPFFSVFMLRDLRFNYLTYTLVVVTVAVTQIFAFDRWGKHADKIGNLKVLRLTSFIIAVLPFLWIINQHPGYLMFAQVVSGFAWSGFNLCAVNFIFDAVTPEKRTRCIAYFNFLNGFALCLGALLGGYLLNILPALFGFKILSLFLISSILRFAVAFLFSGGIKEVRLIYKVKSRDLFYSVIGLRPLGISEESGEFPGNKD